jgi:diacylglycerol kinase family enzyme
MSSILYIINPAGHGGAGIKVWEKLQSKWPDQIDSKDVHFTERQGHAREIATSAEGYDILTAVGGDGTVGEILTGIMAQPEQHFTISSVIVFPTII